MKIGYARVSTEEQNEARQIAYFRDNGIEKVFLDKKSGKNMERPELKKMLAFVRQGDELYIESISRLSRSTKDFLTIFEELKNKGVKLFSQKENINETDSGYGKFMIELFASMAELERSNILERQAEGIAIAKAQGKYHGRQPIKIDEDAMRKECKKWRDGKQTATDTMKKLDMKPNTFYRRVKEMGL